MRPPSLFRPFLTTAIAMCVVSEALAQQTMVAAPEQLAASGPVAAAVAEASRRFDIPEQWIRAVIRVESFGNPSIISPKGAIGLMQVMPKTYTELRMRFGLGPDPFAVHDNVLAGTAYLREMFDRYGLVGMAGAYNAGPARWEAHVAGKRLLPPETVNYVAKLSPTLRYGKSGNVNPAFPSLLAAPIFAALGTSSIPSRLSAEQQRIVAVIDANPSIVMQLSSLFALRSFAERPPFLFKKIASALSVQTKASRRVPSANPLFAQRAVDRNGQ